MIAAIFAIVNGRKLNTEENTTATMKARDSSNVYATSIRVMKSTRRIDTKLRSADCMKFTAILAPNEIFSSKDEIERHK